MFHVYINYTILRWFTSLLFSTFLKLKQLRPLPKVKLEKDNEDPAIKKKEVKKEKEREGGFKNESEVGRYLMGNQELWKRGGGVLWGD